MTKSRNFAIELFLAVLYYGATISRIICFKHEKI